MGCDTRVKLFSKQREVLHLRPKLEYGNTFNPNPVVSPVFPSDPFPIPPIYPVLFLSCHFLLL